eukprot:489947-Hanusia_phi.AAC.1
MSHVFNADGIPGSKFVNISAGQLPGKPGTYRNHRLLSKSFLFLFSLSLSNSVFGKRSSQ